MFKKFFKFLYGYVIIKVYGKGAERFINICLRRNIDVWNIKPFDDGIEMCIYVKDFFHIRQVRKKSNVKIKISQRRGIKHLMRLYRKRYLFLIGFALCIIFFAVSAQFIWAVEINGVENSDINGIISTLDSIGIKSGALKAKLPDGMESKAAIINNNDHIAWAWVYIEGAKARVEIYEQIIPPNILDKDTPCDIVAACDGIINHMVVKNGEEVLNDGDAVKTGDVIVSGKVATYKEGYPEEYIYVHSMADIMAYTTHSKNGDYKLYYESRVPTGKNRYMVSLEVFGKMFSLPLGRMNFEEYFIYPSYRSKILLDQILIGIDYSLWIEEVVFSYTLDSKIDINKAIYCERLEQFINNVIIPKFDSMSEISYESYYRKIFISFLYGDAKNVEDLLFLHIYQWHKIILGKSKLRERYTDEKQDLIDNKNVEFKFSTKRFYQIAMKRFDSTFNNEYDRLNAYGTLRRESNMLFYDYKKDDIKMILSNIKKACEAITYDRTILYRQCQEYLLRYRGE